MKLSRLWFALICLVSIATLSGIVSGVIPHHGALAGETVSKRAANRGVVIGVKMLQPNQAPIANSDFYTVHGSRSLNPMANDTDPDGDSLTFTGIATQPQHGTLVNTNPGWYTYTAAAGYVGSDSFTYTIRDSSWATATGTVSLDVVNQAPIANPDSYTVHGNRVVVPMQNDTDPDNDSRVFVGIATQPLHGTLVAVAPGQYRYTAANGYIGSDSFTYTIRDSLWAYATGTVNLDVANQAPIANADTVRAGPVIKPMVNDTDPDGDPLTFVGIASQPAHGTLSALSPGQYSYLPAAGYTGSDSFTYTIRDSLWLYSTGTVSLYVIGDGENDGAVSCSARVGMPVNVTNGNMYLQQGDYALPKVGPGISLTRTFNSNSQRIGLFGRGWASEYDESIGAYDNNLVRLNQTDGRAIYLGRPAGSSGAFLPLEGDFHSSLVLNGTNGFTVTTTDGSVRQFNVAGKLTSLTDRMGNETTFAYDANGNPLSVSDTFGRTLSFTTNASGRVLAISDSLGAVASYTYGANNQLLSVTYPDNSAFQFTYNSSYKITAVSDALGNILESHTYDSQGRALTSERQGGIERYTLSYLSSTQTRVTDALGRVSNYTLDKSKGRNVVTAVQGMCSCGTSQTQTWTYDSQLNLTAKSDALGHVTSYTYDSNGNRLTETDSLGTRTYTYNSLGEVLTATDTMGGVTANTYDLEGKLLTTKDALNNTTTFTYDAQGLLLTVTDPRSHTTTFTYDPSGNLTRRTDALNNQTDIAYDARGRVTSVTNALNQTTDYEYDPAGRSKKTILPDNNFVLFTYDLAGRKTKVTDPRGFETNFAYDSAYRLTSQTDAANQTTAFSYDSMSQLLSQTDALGRVTNHEYDDFGRLKKTIYPPATAGATRLQETITYDSAGNVTQRIDTAGRATAYLYDAANRLTRVTDPASQATNFEYNTRSQMTALVDGANQRYTFAFDALGRQTQMTRAGVSLSYGYDAVGNRTQRTDYNGVVTNYAYDDLNRLTAINYPDTTSNNYSYDPLSRLLSATNGNGAISFSYDSRGRVASTSDVWNQTIAQTYDANGNRTAMTMGGAGYASFAYDAANRLTQLTDQGGSMVSYGYDATNKQTSRTLPNGVISTYAYDGLDRLTSLRDATVTSVIVDNQYSYNTAGQIVQQVDLGGAHAYEYDTADRLNSATYPGAIAESYSYDSVGNRTTSHVSPTYGYQPFNKLSSTSTASYTYDNNGNLIAKTDSTGTWGYTWDFENRLTQVTRPDAVTVNYSYDALGRRVQRSSSVAATEKYVIDGQDVIADLDANGDVVTTYLNGPGIDNKIRQTDATNGNLYYSTDHLGSTRALTNDSGAVSEQLAYDSFGNSPGSALTRYSYTGREFDPDTGLMYYRARWYDPQVGSFISEDPVGFEGGIDWYVYVGNSPIKFKDPTGLKIWVCSRLTKAPLKWVGANHSYLFDDRNSQTCGLSGLPPHLHGSTDPEKGPFGGDTCRPVDGSDDPSKADQVMNCCRGYKAWSYVPWYDDCHNLTNSCITGAGLKDPGAPGARLGERCVKCRVSPPTPKPGSDSSPKCWGGARGC